MAQSPELLNRANKGYPDGGLAEFFDAETGREVGEDVGDTLGLFIVRELVQTFDADAMDELQLVNAREKLYVGVEELLAVIRALSA